MQLSCPGTAHLELILRGKSHTSSLEIRPELHIREFAAGTANSVTALGDPSFYTVVWQNYMVVACWIA